MIYLFFPILILSIFLVLITYILPPTYLFRSKDGNLKIGSFHNLSNKPNHILYLLLKNSNLTWKTSHNQWDIFIPGIHDYRSCRKINNIKITTPTQKIMGVAGKWNLGSKKKLWNNLLQYHGLKKTLRIMPMTFSLPEDLNILVDRMKGVNKKKEIFVIKKDRQRQNGLILTDDWKKIKNINHHYVIAQKFIPNSYLYQGYRISLRYYLLVILQDNNKSFWIHPLGIVTYANTKFHPNKGEVNFNNSVASFYTSQNKYKSGFPISLNNFYQDIGIDKGLEIWAQVRGLARMVSLAVKDKMGGHNFELGNQSFELFGMDFLIDQNFNTRLIEINVGPGMIPFGQIDKDIRKKVYIDMFDKVQVINNENNMMGENQFRLLANFEN